MKIGNFCSRSLHQIALLRFLSQRRRATRKELFEAFPARFNNSLRCNFSAVVRALAGRGMIEIQTSNGGEQGARIEGVALSEFGWMELNAEPPKAESVALNNVPCGRIMNGCYHAHQCHLAPRCAAAQRMKNE